MTIKELKAALDAYPDTMEVVSRVYGPDDWEGDYDTPELEIVNARPAKYGGYHNAQGGIPLLCIGL